MLAATGGQSVAAAAVPKKASEPAPVADEAEDEDA